jgi:hypothetical protein
MRVQPHFENKVFHHFHDLLVIFLKKTLYLHILRNCIVNIQEFHQKRSIWHILSFNKGL